MHEVDTIRLGCGMVMLEVEIIMFHLGVDRYNLVICEMVLQSGKIKLSCGEVWY